MSNARQYAFACEERTSAFDIIFFIPADANEWSDTVEGSGYVAIDRITGALAPAITHGTTELPAFSEQDIEGIYEVQEEMYHLYIDTADADFIEVFFTCDE